MESLLMAFYLSGGGVLELSTPDQLSEHRPHVIWEPRYEVGAGFEFHPSKTVEVNVGYRLQDLNINPNGPDHDDRTKQIHFTVKWRPFAGGSR